MAESKSDYLGLDYIVSLILAIIPVTSWILGVITRIMEGKTVAGIVRILLGLTGIGTLILWVADLVLMITQKHIWRVLDK